MLFESTYPVSLCKTAFVHEHLDRYLTTVHHHVGGWWYYVPLLLVGFPLNDGGMFLVMIRDLRLNGFALPAFTSYNLSNIPFAYPPLGLYAGAILNLLGVRELDILKWLPAGAATVR